MDASVDELRRFFVVVLPHLNEVQRRVVAGAVAQAVGRGGKTRVAEASGLGRNTVAKGVREIEAGIEPSDRLRAVGAGDKPAIEKQPGLLEALDELVWPETRGHPESPLRWALTSTYELARQLTGQGFRVSAELVRRLLHQMGYSLQAPSKQVEGAAHPDRNAQFEYLNDRVSAALAAGEPVISVDTKKKELIGNYANGGRDWRPGGTPERVNVHDFIDPALDGFGKAIPYGIYDIGMSIWSKRRKSLRSRVTTVIPCTSAVAPMRGIAERRRVRDVQRSGATGHPLVHREHPAVEGSGHTLTEPGPQHRA